MNALHDKAFDRRFFTVTPDFKIKISKNISDIYNGESVEKFFKCYDREKILLPEKFLPNEEFLIYHNENIFENWR